MSGQPDFDTDAAHRWFAIELNNAIWDWLETNTSAEPTDSIVHAAHASYHHWKQVGTVINEARAAVVVANVHATVGSGDAAHIWASECLRLLEQAGDQAQDWDWAFAHDSLARALALQSSPEAAAQAATATAAGEAIAEPGDKQVFDNWVASRSAQ